MTITQIEYFLEVVRCGSFSKAGENLYVSQQVISSQIKAMEKELDLELFNRSNKRRVELTSAGQILAEDWKKIYPVFNESLIKARAASHKNKEIIRVGIEDTPETISFMLPRIHMLNFEHPDISIEYQFAFSSKLENMLNAGKLDMIVVYSSEYENDSKWLYLKNSGYKIALIMDKNYHLADREKITLNDIKDEPFYTFKESYSKHVMRNHLAEFSAQGIIPTNVIPVDNFYELQTAICLGKGVTMSFREQFIGAENLRAFPIEGIVGEVNMNIIVTWKNPQFNKYADLFRKIQGTEAL